MRGYNACCYLHESPDYVRLEQQLPGGIRTRKDSAPFHGARKLPLESVGTRLSNWISSSRRDPHSAKALLRDRSGRYPVLLVSCTSNDDN